MKVLSKLWLVTGVVAIAASAACSKDEAVTAEPVAPSAETASAAVDAKGGAAVNTAKATPAPTPSPAPAAKPESKPEAKPAKPESKPEKPAVASNSNGKKLFVTLHGLNVRSGPGKSHSVVRVLKFNEEVSDLGRKSGWVKISEGNYVWAKFLSPSKNAKPVAAPKSEPKAAPAAKGNGPA